MDLHLEGKVIIITGGFKGIGKGITLQLAQEGAIPVVINRSDSALEEFKKDIEQYTTEYDVHLLDLNDTDKIAGIVEETYKKYGHIDGIVNNAGKNDNKDLETTTWREFEESIHGNLTHYYELVHAAVPYLKESHGAVVNISSKTALTGQGKTSAYAAAKGAILGLTREWAAALVKDRVRVNAIVVSECWTPLYADRQNPAGAPHDHHRGDRQRGGVPVVRPFQPHHRPVGVRRRRLRPPRSCAELTTSLFPNIRAAIPEP